MELERVEQPCAEIPFVRVQLIALDPRRLEHASESSDTCRHQTFICELLRLDQNRTTCQQGGDFVLGPFHRSAKSLGGNLPGCVDERVQRG